MTKKIKVYFLSDTSQEEIVSRSKQFQSVVTELKTSLRTQKSEDKFHNYKIGGNVKKKVQLQEPSIGSARNLTRGTQ